jgi:hypothetical protein
MKRCTRPVLILNVVACLVVLTGCQSVGSRYRFESVKTSRDFVFPGELGESGKEQYQLLDQPEMTSFSSTVMIDKKTGETWLFVPEYETEQSHWLKLPRRSPGAAESSESE